MREILFRGKRIDNECWETGSLVIVRGGLSDEAVYIADKMTGYHTPVIPETVCQYTGFKDRNGCKIFEGDIVVIGHHEELLYIAMDGASWSCMSKKYIHYRHRLEHGTPYEVVGNIHNDLDYERLLGGIRRSGPDIIAQYQPWQEDEHGKLR